MNLIEKFENEILKLRKAKNPLFASAQTVLADAKKVEKASKPRKMTEQDLLKSLKSTLKGLSELKEYAQVGDKIYYLATEQIALFEKFLPKQLTRKELIVVISSTIATDEKAQKGLKSLGFVMSVLKKKYPDQFDGRQAVFLFKEIIS